MTRRAWSPSPRWTTDLIDAPWIPSSWAIWASTPGRSTTSMCRLKADREAVIYALRGPDQLQPQPELPGVGQIVGRDVLDPLVAHVLEAHRHAEGQAGEDRHLGGCVLAVDVVAGIRLRIAEPLRLRQGLLVGHSGAGHLGEDEVGRPVDDPVDALDVSAGEGLLQDPDDGDHAGHGGLEAKLDVGLVRGLPQLVAALREQLLVGRDHVASRSHRAQYVVARRLDAPDQLDDQLRAFEDVLDRSPAAGQHTGQLGTA